MCTDFQECNFSTLRIMQVIQPPYPHTHTHTHIHLTHTYTTTRAYAYISCVTHKDTHICADVSEGCVLVSPDQTGLWRCYYSESAEIWQEQTSMQDKICLEVKEKYTEKLYYPGIPKTKPTSWHMASEVHKNKLSYYASNNLWRSSHLKILSHVMYFTL